MNVKLLATAGLALLLITPSLGNGQQRAAKKKAPATAPPIPLTLFFGNQPPPPKRKPANGYEEILFEFLQINHDLLTEMRAAKTPPERRAILEQRPQPKQFGSRFLKYAQRHPQEETALDALAWIASNVRIDKVLDEAVDLLIERHLEDQRLTRAISSGPAVSPSAARQRLLTTMLEKSPHANVRSAACVQLARMHAYTARISPQVVANPDRFVKIYGKETVELVQQLGDASALLGRAEQLFASALNESGDLETLLTVLEQSTGASRDAALSRLIANHASEPQFVERVRSLALRATHSDSNERLLRTLLDTSLSRQLHGPALLGLAKLRKAQSALSHRLRNAPQTQVDRYNRSYGAEYVRRVGGLNSADLVSEAIGYLERVIADYADVSGEVKLNGRVLSRGTLAAQAQPILFEIKQLSIGKPAPEIAAEDLEGIPFKLSDYRGKVVMIDFWGHW